MQESIVFLLRVQCRRKESSRSLSHHLMSFLCISAYVAVSHQQRILSSDCRSNTLGHRPSFVSPSGFHKTVLSSEHWLDGWCDEVRISRSYRNLTLRKKTDRVECRACRRSCWSSAEQHRAAEGLKRRAEWGGGWNMRRGAVAPLQTGLPPRKCVKLVWKYVHIFACHFVKIHVDKSNK